MRKCKKQTNKQKAQIVNVGVKQLSKRGTPEKGDKGK